MCQVLKTKEKEIECIGELKQLFPVLVTWNNAEIPCDDNCLCLIDIEASAKINNKKVMREEIGDYVLIE